MPRKIDGIASSQSGTSSTGGDSWMCGSTLRVDAALAPERQPDQPEHVERGHDGDDDADAQTHWKPSLNASPRISSLLKKPASGGMPAIAIAPMSIVR